jgi:hypothetical protein
MDLTRKHYTRLEKLARDIHSNLLQKYLNYGQKMFIILGPGPKVMKYFASVIYGCLQ